MDKQLEKLIQDQIKNEWYSAYLYLSMAAWFESENLEGFAHWMYKQARRGAGPREEDVRFPHRPRREGRPAGHRPAAGGLRFGPWTCSKRAYEHEQKVTALINGIADQADKVERPPHEGLHPVVHHRAGGRGKERLADPRPAEEDPAQLGGHLPARPPAAASASRVRHRRCGRRLPAARGPFLRPATCSRLTPSSTAPIFDRHQSAKGVTYEETLRLLVVLGLALAVLASGRRHAGLRHHGQGHRHGPGKRIRLPHVGDLPECELGAPGCTPRGPRTSCPRWPRATRSTQRVTSTPSSCARA